MRLKASLKIATDPLIAVFLAFIALAFAPGSFAQNYMAVPLTSDSAPAPTTTPASTPAPGSLSSNRFLFVVDISAPMHSHLHDIIGVEESILRSGASGQLHNGDTIGVWTFNENVYTGSMPLQIWSANDSEEIALRIAEFIRQQNFGKKSRLDVAMVPVAKVFKMSDIITAFIISSGASPIRGTPYDDDINNQYAQCVHDMGKKPMPVVTVLQGKSGKFIRYTVNALPWPVVIPELPIPLKIAEEPAPAVAPKAADQSIAANTATNQSEGFTSPPYAFPPTPLPAATPTAAPAQPAVAPVPAPMPQPQAAPPVVVATAPSPAPAVVAPAPQPAPPAIPAPVPAVAPVTVSETPAPAAPVPSPVQPTVAVHPATSGQLPLVAPRPPPLVPKTLPAASAMTPDTAPATPAPETAPASAPAVAAAPAQTAPAAPVQAPPKTLVAQATALVKSFTGNHRSLLLIGGVSLLVVATGLILLMARRSRAPGRVSLISQTMNDRRP